MGRGDRYLSLTSHFILFFTFLQVLIIGAGPCGLRTAIELVFLGAKVVVIEKRDRFTRNNVLYLWPYLITDLTNLGAKKLYGGFGAGDINHISELHLPLFQVWVDYTFATFTHWIF